ncbi:MAG: GTP-binding protein, partial [Nocardiopsaceae bacterium]|nr:GTP-binding protein [Nocardiopsaceae bacterium]
AAYVGDEAAISYQRLRAALAEQARRALVHPVLFGSAITGAGVPDLAAGLAELLPAARGDAGGPVSGTVFKVERGPAGEKIAWARMFSGTVRIRDRLRFGADQTATVTGVSVAGGGAAAPDGTSAPRGPAAAARRGQAAAGRGRRAAAGMGGQAAAGQIARLWGLGGIQIGDTLGSGSAAGQRRQFAPPTLETVVVPACRADKGALHLALTQLAEQDPLINLRQDDSRQEIYLSLYGEVQKEVIQATLAAGFGLDVSFRQTTTICIERLAGTGAAVERLDDPPNPFLATIGLRIEPAAPGSGVTWRIEAEPGSMPQAFFKAVEDTVRETLRQGRYGWEVPDCAVTMTHSGYVGKHSLGHARFTKSLSSTGEDYRKLTPLVVISALRQAGTTVHEPVNRFQLEIPADTLAPLLQALAGLRAVVRDQQPQGTSCLLEGTIPAASVHQLQQQLPALTRGEGLLESAFGHYQPVRGPVPHRPRTGLDPRNRKEYLLHATRRV